MSQSKAWYVAGPAAQMQREHLNLISQLQANLKVDGLSAVCAETDLGFVDREDNLVISKQNLSAETMTVLRRLVALYDGN